MRKTQIANLFYLEPLIKPRIRKIYNMSLRCHLTQLHYPLNFLMLGQNGHNFSTSAASRRTTASSHKSSLIRRHHIPPYDLQTLRVIHHATITRKTPKHRNLKLGKGKKTVLLLLLPSSAPSHQVCGKNAETP